MAGEHSIPDDVVHFHRCMPLLYSSFALGPVHRARARSVVARLLVTCADTVTLVHQTTLFRAQQIQQH
jgi:hypothetical protein